MTSAACSTPPAFGVLADRVKDQLVLLEDGYLFASPWVVSETARFSAAIVLTVDDSDDFEFDGTGQAQRCRVVVTRPFGKRQLRARGVPIVSIGVSPNDPSYRRFRGMGPGASLVLPRALFSEFDALLAELYDGSISLPMAQVLFDGVVAAVAAQLPSPEARDNDPRVRRVLRMLRAQPIPGLDELAAASGLSYDRMSHLFAEEVGLPLRSFLLAQKMYRACQLVGSGLSLTGIAAAAGFADSAHFCKVWVKAFGGSPTYFFCNDRVTVKSAIQVPDRTNVEAMMSF